jgi:acetoin utilization protein AcuB
MLIVNDIMTTNLITVTPDETLAHAANLFRQHNFHHLPVARTVDILASQDKPQKALLLEGLLTAQDIDLAAALAQQEGTGTPQQPWQERHVVDVMHRALLRVTPTTSIAAAAQMLVDRNLNYLPVVDYGLVQGEDRALLVGLITRSDLLLTLARVMGALEPGMQLDILLPGGNIATLGRVLILASELHMHVSSVIASPDTDGVVRITTLRLGTINPTPLLLRLKAENIQFSFGNPFAEGETYV